MENEIRIIHAADLHLDSPFSGLDADNRQKMLRLIRISTEGKLCLFVTHSTEEACEIGGTRLSFSGPPLLLC